MPGFRISNIKTESTLQDLFREKCVSGILGGGVLLKGKP